MIIIGYHFVERSNPKGLIFSKIVLFEKSFICAERQTDRQTNILNHLVKTSRSAKLRLPRGNKYDFSATDSQTYSVNIIKTVNHCQHA